MCKIIGEKNSRGHPGLNRGPLDLQKNALSVRYTPPKTSDVIITM